MSLQRLIAVLAFIGFALCKVPAHPQIIDKSNVASGVEVKEWVIIVCDPYRPRANPAATVGCTLPPLIGSLRPPTAESRQTEPSPIGVIRFYGRSEQKFT